MDFPNHKGVGVWEEIITTFERCRRLRMAAMITKGDLEVLDESQKEIVTLVARLTSQVRYATAPRDQFSRARMVLRMRRDLTRKGRPQDSNDDD